MSLLGRHSWVLIAVLLPTFPARSAVIHSTPDAFSNFTSNAGVTVVGQMTFSALTGAGRYNGIDCTVASGSNQLGYDVAGYTGGGAMNPLANTLSLDNRKTDVTSAMTPKSNVPAPNGKASGDYATILPAVPALGLDGYTSLCLGLALAGMALQRLFIAFHLIKGK